MAPLKGCNDTQEERRGDQAAAQVKTELQTIDSHLRSLETETNSTLIWGWITHIELNLHNLKDVFQIQIFRIMKTRKIKVAVSFTSFTLLKVCCKLQLSSVYQNQQNAPNRWKWNGDLLRPQDEIASWAATKNISWEWCNASSTQTHPLTTTIQTWTTSVICAGSLTRTDLPPLTHFSQHEHMTRTPRRFYRLWPWEPAWLTWLCFSQFVLMKPKY